MSPKGEVVAPPPARPTWPHHLAAYTVSLPERTLRQGAALVGGLARVLSFVVPRPLREGRFFRLAVERQIRMLSDDVGQAGIYGSGGGVDRKTAIRLGLGGAIDNLLVLTLHASPLWLLLAASDVAGSARRLVAEIGRELASAGVMHEGSRLDSVDDVLAGLSRLSDRAADTLDKPPITLDQMKTAVGELKDRLTEVADATVGTARIEEMAKGLLDVAESTRRSPLEVATALAASVMRTTNHLVLGTAATTTATLRVVGRTLDDTIGDYARSLDRLRRLGFTGGLVHFLAPLLRSRRRLFAYPFLSFTESALSFGRWRAAPWRLR